MLKYSLYLFEFTPFETAFCLIHCIYYFRTGKTGTRTMSLSRKIRNYCFISETNAWDHHEPWNISTWPLAGLYLNEKEVLDEGSTARGFEGIESCSALLLLCIGREKEVVLGLPGVRRELWSSLRNRQSLKEVTFQLSLGIFLFPTSYFSSGYFKIHLFFCLFKTVRNLIQWKMLVGPGNHFFPSFKEDKYFSAEAEVKLSIMLI